MPVIRAYLCAVQDQAQRAAEVQARQLALGQLASSQDLCNRELVEFERALSKARLARCARLAHVLLLQWQWPPRTYCPAAPAGTRRCGPTTQAHKLDASSHVSQRWRHLCLDQLGADMR